MYTKKLLEVRIMYTDNIEHVRESEERIIDTIEIVEDYNG